LNDFVCAVAVIDLGVEGVCDPADGEDRKASNREGPRRPVSGEDLNAAPG
jgi:hypothetical protein